MTVTTLQTEQPITRENTGFARWVAILEPAALLAQRLAGTEFVPAPMRNKPDAITACIMYGDEIGIGPMQSLAGINVIDGRPSPSSELLRALIYAAGHSLQIVTLTGTSCTLAGKRREESDWTQITWTDAMARNAGLFSKRGSVWNNYPRAMLLARCSSELARIKFPDIVKGLGHIADDDATAADFENWATSVAGEVPAEPPTRTIERRRRAGATPSPARDTAAPAPGAAPTAGSVEDEAPDPAAGNVAPPMALTDDEIDTPPTGPPPDPDPDGGPLPADDSAPEVFVSPRQIKAIMAGFNDIRCDNRTLRLAITRAVINRDVATSLQLTRREAFTLIATLSDLATGARTMVIAPNGSVTIINPEENTP